MSEPLDLYFWPTPNGWKITIMLEECGLPYRLCMVDIGKGEQFTPAFQRISPNARMPALVDPQGRDGGPLMLFESGAILQYLGDKAGRFYPQPRADRSMVEQWLFWQTSGLGPMVGQAAHFNYRPDKIAYAIERYVGEVRRLYSVADRRLGEAEYLGGEYSIADIATWPWIRGYKALGINLAEFPNLGRWFRQVGARDAVRKGADIGKEAFVQAQAARKARAASTETED
jgi:GST-like protein